MEARKMSTLAQGATSTGASALPGAGADGFFGIRFESIGGLGAHLAGQILAEAGVLRQGLNGAHFSSYGSEKKGTPVKSFVRLGPADRELRTSSPIETPQVVAVFHEALTHSLDVAAGLGPNGTLIMNTRKSPEEIRDSIGLRSGTIVTLDALGIALEEKTRVNTAMLGAVARICPFLDIESIKATIAAKLSAKHPELAEMNLRTFDRGFAEMKMMSWPAEPGDEGRPAQRPQPAYGYLDAPIGGIITDSGNSIVKNLSTSRQGFVPAYDENSCVHCGICDIVCPDMCFVWSEDEDSQPSIRLAGIDYNYCKGCMKCIDACPTGSLTQLREEDGWADANRIPLFPWLEPAKGADK
jgi:pyruvate ferredoxin oxidoreductase gamma subunit